MRTALTIAGSDSGAGAGIQADLKTFSAHGVYGTSAITAITAQNTLALSDTVVLTPKIVTAQIKAVVEDFQVDAIKIGMLSTHQIVKTVAAIVAKLNIKNVVVDPVMLAKTGNRLLDDDAVVAVKENLLPYAAVVTPNAVEAAILAGITVSSLESAREAARRIHALGPATVVVKGGHLDTPKAIDLLYDGKEFTEFAGPRLTCANTHGTGCTFGAAIAANLALGYPIQQSVARAKEYVAQAIRHGLPLGRGHHIMWHKTTDEPV